MELILQMILFGFFISIFERITEVTHMKNRLAIWIKFWNIDPLNKWWCSGKQGESKKWYNWLWDGSYHTFKRLHYLSIIYFVYTLLEYPYFTLDYWPIVSFVLSICTTQILFDVILFKFMDNL